jgi:hypothetical protein
LGRKTANPKITELKLIELFSPILRVLNKKNVKFLSNMILSGFYNPLENKILIRVNFLLYIKSFSKKWQKYDVFVF